MLEGENAEEKIMFPPSPSINVYYINVEIVRSQTFSTNDISIWFERSGTGYTKSHGLVLYHRLSCNAYAHNVLYTMGTVPANCCAIRAFDTSNRLPAHYIIIYVLTIRRVNKYVWPPCSRILVTSLNVQDC